MVMVNPWRPLAFYFQSTLNCTVNDIPVLAAPRDFVKETLWKSSEGFPVPFVHCYRAITIVIPDSPGHIATATTMQEDDLRSVNCLSFGTVLKWKRSQLICESERIVRSGGYQMYPDFEFLTAFLVTKNQAFEDSRNGVFSIPVLTLLTRQRLKRHRKALGSRLQEGEDVFVVFSISFLDPLSWRH